MMSVLKGIFLCSISSEFNGTSEQIWITEQCDFIVAILHSVDKSIRYDS